MSDLLNEDDKEFQALNVTALQLLDSIEGNFELPSKVVNSGEVTVETGDWCLVKYDNVYYPGLVEEVVEQEYKVSVMVRSGPSRWKWPQPPDCVWYEKGNVLRKIMPPDVVASRGQFEFTELQYLDLEQ